MTKEQEALVLNNMNLVRWFCKKYHIDYEEHNDVLFEALVKSAIHYNKESNYTFSTFAVKAMYNTAVRAWKITNKCKPEGTLSLDYATSDKESNNETTLLDVIECNDSIIDSFIPDIDLFKVWFNKQTKKEQKIMLLLGRGLSGQDVANEMGISRQRINVIKIRLLQSYKKYKEIHLK